jgi:hypothetical protein
MDSDDDNNLPVIDDRIIVGLPPPERVKKSSRNRWGPLELSTDNNGIKEYTYPFVDDPGDMALISYFCTYKPFAQPFGKTCPAWQKCLNGLKGEKLNNDEYIFKDGVLAMQTIKNRWDDYVEFIKDYQARVPFYTGGDNEPEPALLVELKKLVNAYSDFQGAQVTKKNKLHSKKQKELDAADNHRVKNKRYPCPLLLW